MKSNAMEFSSAFLNRNIFTTNMLQMHRNYAIRGEEKNFYFSMERAFFFTYLFVKCAFKLKILHT